MVAVSTELTPAEIWLLSSLYDLGEADIYGVLDHIKKERDWKYTTVQTMIHHMCDKGYIVREKVGRRFIYKPTKSRPDMFEDVMNKLFGDSLKNDPEPIVNYLLKLKKVKKADEKAVREMFK